jgi:DNA-binding NarL/FixJ family response regulator
VRTISIKEAIESALSKELALPKTPAPQELGDGTTAGKLTRREQEVAALVARGLTNRQIATELSISNYTVANHVARILRKLRLSTRSQITAWVVQRRTPR